jgi:hypothetical protein
MLYNSDSRIMVLEYNTLYHLLFYTLSDQK